MLLITIAIAAALLLLYINKIQMNIAVNLFAICHLSPS